MASETTENESEQIRASGRLRILVVGKSGVGKSTLISYAFGVDKESVSHSVPGKANIDDEILPLKNPFVAVHDSMGFEPGSSDNLEKAEDFVRRGTSANVSLENQLHIIWLCILIPHAGGRVFEDGDEIFLRLASERNVPVLVVFTQFDKVIRSLRDEPISTEAKEKHANQIYEKLCVVPLREMNPDIQYARTAGLSGGPQAKPDMPALANLVEMSRDLVRNKGPNNAWIVYSIAQRANVKVKIEACVELGMKGHWKMLGSATMIPGLLTLDQCLDKIHDEMVDSWNFYDPGDRLRDGEFRKKMKILAQLAAPSGAADARTWFPDFSTDMIEQLIVPVVGTTATRIAVELSARFVTMLATAYQNTEPTLRCFMAYIVGLTLILHKLFIHLLRWPPEELSEGDMAFILETCELSIYLAYADIRKYVDKAAWGTKLNSGAAQKEVIRLVLKYTGIGGAA